MIRCFALVLILIATSSPLWAAQPDDATKLATRPQVQALLNDGSWVEGVLQRFDGGVYTVLSDGKVQSFREDEVRTIAFQPRAVKPPARVPLTRPIDELIADLAKDTYGEKNKAAIEELASQGNEGTAALLEAVGKNYQLSHVAGKVFLAMGPEVLPQLVRIARRESNASVRSAVRKALGDFAMDALPYIKDLMADKDVQLREMGLDLLYSLAIQSTTVLPAAFEEPLIRALGDPSAKVRGNAAMILGRMGRSSDRVIAPLIETVEKDLDRQVATRAVSSLLTIAGERAPDQPGLKTIVDALTKAVAAHREPAVRGSAASGLGELGSKAAAAVPVLRKATDDPNQSVGQAARLALHKMGDTLNQALRRLGTDEATMGLIQAITLSPKWGQSELQQRQTAAVAALAAAGPKNLEALMTAVRLDEKYAYWPRVAQIMSRWGKTALPEFDKYVRDEHHRVRRTVAYALGRMDLDAIPDALPVLLDDRDASVRWSVCDTVVKLSKHPKPELRKKAVALLIIAMDDDQMHREYWWRACHTLAELAPTHGEALTAMLKILKHDKDEGRRSTVARDLGSVAVALKHGDDDFALILRTLAETLEREASHDVKRGAILGLELIALRRKGEALTLLKKAADSPNQRVSAVAREILERVQKRPGFGPDPPPLEEPADDDPFAN